VGVFLSTKLDMGFLLFVGQNRVQLGAVVEIPPE